MMSIIFVSRMSSRRWADWAEFKAALMAFLPDDSPFLFAGTAAPAAAVPFDAAAVVRLKKKRQNEIELVKKQHILIGMTWLF